MNATIAVSSAGSSLKARHSSRRAARDRSARGPRRTAIDERDRGAGRCPRSGHHPGRGTESNWRCRRGHPARCLPGCTAPDDRRSAVARWLVRREGPTRRTRAEGLGTACRTLYTTARRMSTGSIPNAQFPTSKDLLPVWELGVGGWEFLRGRRSIAERKGTFGRPRYRVARSRCR